MTFLRLIIIIFLFYLIYRVLKGLFRSEVLDGNTGNQHINAAPADDLMEDPVCGVYVPKSQALSAKKDGETYYFCSRDCMDKFLSDGK